MKPPKLYQTLTEKQLNKFLKELGTSTEKEPLVEISDNENDLHGDFIVVKEYKFKKIYSEYQCMKTPIESHKKRTLNMPKAANDYYKKS